MTIITRLFQARAYVAIPARLVHLEWSIDTI